MPKWLLLALAAGCLHAAVIRGVVVENQTGRPLARVLVVIEPVAGTRGQRQSARTNPYGAFEFPPVGPGAYLVTASKRSFASVQYGQKQWKAAGVPIVIEEASAPFLSLRLPHFGAITGSVVDENDVGLPELDVVAYRGTHPPQLAGRGHTDDRGVFRIGGLEPGSYVVRTLPKQYDEGGGYLPTFSHDAARLQDALSVPVTLDQQVDDIKVRPAPGQLITMAGQAPTNPPTIVTLTLVSDMGSETAVSDGAGNYRFKPQAPGQYELFAQAQGNDRRGTGPTAGYRQVSLERDRTDYRINLGAPPELRVALEDTKGRPVELGKVQVQLRRKDLSGVGPPEALRTSPLRVLPGRWELSIVPSAAFYAAAFSGPLGDSERGRADSWNEILLANPGEETVKFVLSPNPASVHGTVTDTDGDPVVGALVFLEAFDPESHRRLLDLRSARSDLTGKYRFEGLAPGTYRVLSSFEFQMPDSAALDTAGATVFKAEERQDLAADLKLYVIRPTR